MDAIEFVVKGTPISAQSPGANLEAWKGRIRQAAYAAGAPPVPTRDEVALHVIYFYAGDPSSADLDNLVKAIQDAIATILFDNDAQVRDLSVRRRDIAGAYVIADASETIVSAIRDGEECVYIRVSEPLPSELLD